jgi:hypothetical protein
LQPLVTALRRAGKLDRVGYGAIFPHASDDSETNECKWHRWVEQESYKRLVHHVFEHDIYSALTKVRAPLTSYAELSLPLPAARELWMAPSAGAWRSTYLDLTSFTSEMPSLRDLLADCEKVRFLSKPADERLAKTMYLYGIAAQCWVSTDGCNHSLLFETAI